MFSGKRAQQNVDTQGTTWLIEDSTLIFTCFIPHSAAVNQSFIDIPTQKGPHDDQSRSQNPTLLERQCPYL